MRKCVLLVGGRNKAKALAQSLLKKNYKVIIINKEYKDCLDLSTVEGVTVVYGDGTKPYTLEEAGAENVDIAIALTAKDEDNLVICELCKLKFNVKKTVALLTDPQKTEFFYKVGIDRVVCAISVVTGFIEQQAFMEEMLNTISIGEGRIQIIEIPIENNDSAVGKKLWQLNLPKEAIVGCILRGDKNLIPKGDTTILLGDVLVLISGNEKGDAAIKVLKGK